MTRINRTGNTGPQSLPSQDAGGSQQISKPESQRNQEPGAAEQQQNKQAAEGRKNEMNLQGNLKQSELAQFHGPGGGGLGGGPLGGVGDGQGNQISDEIVPDAISGAGKIVPRQKTEQDLQKELSGLVIEQAEMFWEYDLDIKDRQIRAGKEILETYVPKKESNSSKKTE